MACCFPPFRRVRRRGLCHVQSSTVLDAHLDIKLALVHTVEKIIKPSHLHTFTPSQPARLALRASSHLRLKSIIRTNETRTYSTHIRTHTSANGSPRHAPPLTGAAHVLTFAPSSRQSSVDPDIHRTLQATPGASSRHTMIACAGRDGYNAPMLAAMGRDGYNGPALAASGRDGYNGPVLVAMGRDGYNGPALVAMGRDGYNGPAGVAMGRDGYN
ncbi:MAG: hypothetical protein M1815_006201 [Lichina confinis]|nr:MAG: hypothetical protein M1815_006201 [Lichina confinis]